MARRRKNSNEARVSITFYMEESVVEAIQRIADERTLNISLYLERLLLDKMPGLRGTVDNLRAEAKQAKLFEEEAGDKAKGRGRPRKVSAEESAVSFTSK